MNDGRTPLISLGGSLCIEERLLRKYHFLGHLPSDINVRIEGFNVTLKMLTLTS